jgi:hypothetical protein
MKVNELSNLNDLWDDFDLIPTNVRIVSITPYEINKNHSKQWIELLMLGNTGTAKSLVKLWLESFIEVIYKNTYFHKHNKLGYISLETEDRNLTPESILTAKVVVVFQ